ncbi:hypothetical protein DP939_22930 [Spongiactinospora rosea]|uniref:Alkyl hydroperoxide reductase subunit C/ Thiol specific antioxidant domain-containing protein n=1 Tax=Spongiactinospora rosea TaxID=2248750 RepID=A0A366LWI2_9ACTN|nr:redoxin domain-containing protein [Spongiactinospora rosea]RBQ17729.1 hypothetical protein DP939_22930 [Spongiactinospora rosea]
MLSSIVAAIALVTLLNVILTIGVVRRLRDQHTVLESLRHQQPGPTVGAVVGDFAGAATTGHSITPKSLAGRETLVAFFSNECEPCRTKLPRFVNYVIQQQLAKHDVLAVVVGQERDSSEFVSQLAPVCTVATEEFKGEIAAAFQVSSYPTTVRLRSEGGNLVVSEIDVDLDAAAAL